MRSDFIFRCLPLIAAGMLSGCGPRDEVGRPYCGWHRGEMDIHHIYTGRGESGFLIFPDATTMLIDAGDWDPADYPLMCEPKPDMSRRAGAWIARYVGRVDPAAGKVDYLMISHLHNDHTGDCSNPAPVTSGRDPDYVLTGIAEVGETLRFGKAFDRGWPDYDYPYALEDKDVDNYRAFAEWHARRYGMVRERFEVGRDDQIRLLNAPDRYEGLFSVLNLAANAEIVTPDGRSTVRCYDLDPANLESYRNENSKSICLRIDYGPFRYYTGGDMCGTLLDARGDRIRLDEPVAEACGRVDVCKVNHHGYLDSMSEGFVRNVRARVYVMDVWDHQHIQPSVLGRLASDDIYTGDRMIFPTNVPDTLRRRYAGEPWMERVCPVDGHVVIKVCDGGRRYKVYVLTADDESMTVKAVYGPYDSCGGAM